MLTIDYAESEVSAPKFSYKTLNVWDKIYHKTGKFMINKVLGSGSFGTVVSTNKCDKRVALKMIKINNLEESTFWPQLLHPNVLPVIDIFMDQNEVLIYAIPECTCTMFSLLNSIRFNLKPSSFHLVRKWHYQLLCALNYLHDNGLYHLDIKMDNVLISSNGNAILSDFSCLTKIKKINPKRKIGMPDVYMAPEISKYARDYYLGNDLVDEPIAVSSEKLDMWGCGIIIFEFLTGLKLRRLVRLWTLRNKSYFSGQVSMEVIIPYLDKVFRNRDKFDALVQKNFRMRHISAKKLNDAADFIKHFLTYLPDNRSSARECLRHPYLVPWNFTEENILDDTNDFEYKEKTNIRSVSSPNLSKVEKKMDRKSLRKTKAKNSRLRENSWITNNVSKIELQPIKISKCVGVIKQGPLSRMYRYIRHLWNAATHALSSKSSKKSENNSSNVSM